MISANQYGEPSCQRAFGVEQQHINVLVLLVIEEGKHMDLNVPFSTLTLAEKKKNEWKWKSGSKY